MVEGYTIADMAFLGDDFLFELRNVSKSFRTPLSNPFKPREEVRALDSAALHISGSRITCLLGPNGAGKTTLIKILAGLIIPDSGEILYRGLPRDRAGNSIQGAIGLVTPNERAFYWRLSGRENLLFFGRLNGFRGARLKRRVAEVLDEAGMADSADLPYRVYSAGMKQKLNIARALLGNPSLYLLDEPAAHLDPVAREEFRSFIVETLVERRGATVFLCTHDLEEARALADDIVVLNEGRVVAQGDRRELLEPTIGSGDYILSFAGAAPAAWLDARRSWASLEGPGRMRISLDTAEETQDAAIASFIGDGGRVLEAYRSGDPLLDFIKRATRKHA